MGESTEFNDVAKEEIPKTKKKKNRKKKKNNGFEVTDINIVNEQDSGNAANITEIVNENPVVLEESNRNELDVEFKTKKKKKKKNIDILNVNDTVENKSKKRKTKNTMDVS